MLRFIGIFQFLTTISIKKDIPWDEEFYKGIVYFPIVGILLGILLAAVYYVTALLLPINVVVIILFAFYSVIASGLHLDGLGDTFDGFYSGRSKEKILDIMKDSRLGTNGLLAITFVILIKIMCLMSLSQETAVLAILTMPIYGRLSIVLASYKATYARNQGLGDTFIGKVTALRMMFSIIITLAFVTFFMPIGSLFFLLLMMMVIIFRYHCNNKIGGMTGDTLGGICEMTETGYLLFMALL